MSAARATAPKCSAYIAARRTSATGRFAAAAIASSITPANAPCRNSPAKSRMMKSRSAVVLRAKRSRSRSNRLAAEPVPRVLAICVKCASSSASVSVACAAGSTLRGSQHCRVLNADLALRNLAAQVVNGDLDLGRFERAERARKLTNLRRAQRSARDAAGYLYKVGYQGHSSFSYPSNVRTSARVAQRSGTTKNTKGTTISGRKAGVVRHPMAFPPLCSLCALWLL